MRTIAIILAAAFAAAPAFAQDTKVKGTTTIDAKQTNVAAVAVGKDNKAANTAGAIKGKTSVQGRTDIKAKQTNAAAVAVGKGNTATNEAGVIGDAKK